MAQDALVGWHAGTADLVAQLGQRDFPEALAKSLATLAPFDLTVAFGYPAVSGPVLLHDGLGGISPPEIMQNYLSGTYLLDAVYAACRAGGTPGLYRLAMLAPDAFFEADYYHSPLVHPCISMQTGTLAEEIVFLAQIGTTWLALSLMRQNGRTPFSDAEFAVLRATAPMVTALMAQHWREAAGTERPPEQMLELAFQTFAADVLTRREQEIVSLVLRGHSSASIGQVLAIAEGTVKIHRKHIHAKLGIASQGELFARFVTHVLRK